MVSEVYIENLFLDSGGLYGFSICGSLQYLKEKKLLDNIKNVLGCSVGAIVALLFCLDFTIEEITAIAFNLDTSKLVNFKKNNFFNIYQKYGFESGEKLVSIIKTLIKNKTKNENITFQSLYDRYHKDLIIIGSNVNSRTHDIFNREITPNMEVWKAIRITCGIPLLFQPFQYLGNYYVDGGNSVYNTNYFKNKHQTIGILLETSSIHSRKINTFEDFLKNLVFFPLKILKFTKYENVNCIEINTNDPNISGLDFTLKNKDKIELYLLGYQETRNKLDLVLNNLKNMKEQINNNYKSSLQNTRDISTQTDL